MLPWLSWSTDAFQRAHRTHRPVLLSIVTGWSAACQEMDAGVFAQPAVAAAVEAHAVPVRVDADLRPDIADRYGLGGWPTTVWLTPDGEMLTGGTYVDAGTLASTVVDVCARFQRDRTALVRHAAAARAARQQARVAAAAAAGPPMTLAAIRDGLIREFDPEHGGFGRAAKFPLAAPILFALRAGVLADDAELIAVAEHTLDHIADGPISDSRTGAFHRASAHADWTEPDPARLLDVQVEMIGVYIEAYRLLHHDRYRARALAALEYVDQHLREREHGAFYHFETTRDDARLIVTESNARLIRTLVRASDVLGDNRWILAAVDVAERLVPAVYVRASGVARCLVPAAPNPAAARAADAASALGAAGAAGGARDAAGRERAAGFGLLADTIFMAAALLDLGEAAGQGVYVELAEELGRSCVRRFWDVGAGAFGDRMRTTAGAGDTGLLGEMVFPFVANVEAARLLGRLAVRTQDAGLGSHARDTLRAVGVAACREGILSSEYGLLLLELGQNSPDGQADQNGQPDQDAPDSA
jgi:uncharacterized protein YyaL (SSP411 family)